MCLHSFFSPFPEADKRRRVLCVVPLHKMQVIVQIGCRVHEGLPEPIEAHNDIVFSLSPPPPSAKKYHAQVELSVGRAINTPAACKVYNYGFHHQVSSGGI